MSLINSITGEESVLFEREGSKCHFNKKINHDNYIIYLRVDWDDIRSGEPTLDADIWRKPKCEKNRLKKGLWHHTTKEIDDSGKKAYHFKFSTLELILTSKMRVQHDILSKADIIRKNEEKGTEEIVGLTGKHF